MFATCGTQVCQCLNIMAMNTSRSCVHNTREMLDHCGASLCEHYGASFMVCHDTLTMIHVSIWQQGWAAVKHWLGFTLRSWAKSLLCMSITYAWPFTCSNLNLCALFQSAICDWVACLHSLYGISSGICILTWELCVLQFGLSSLPVSNFHATATVCAEVKHTWPRVLLKLNDMFECTHLKFTVSDEEHSIWRTRHYMQQWNPSSGVLFPPTGWLDSTPVCIPEWSF